MPFVTMILASAAIIALVKFGLVRGIRALSSAQGWSAKRQGQAMGYATSAPELVTLVAAGLSGVWDAGLWNIASSNIINASLLLLVVFVFGRQSELLHRGFRDELGFAALAILAPLLLMHLELDTRWESIPLLFGLFWVYLLLDRRLNPPVPEPDEGASVEGGSVAQALLICALSLILIAGAGFFLGQSTRDVVENLGVHPALAGWILGVVTSLPEVVSFFAVYQDSRQSPSASSRQATQEALDNLAASNMSNTGLIYPLGLSIFLLVSSLR